MNPFPLPPSNDPWQRLATRARRAPVATPPAGGEPGEAEWFTAQVVARWLRPPAVPAPVVLPWETWSLRGLVAAGVVALGLLAASLPALSDGFVGPELATLDPWTTLFPDF